MKHHPEPTVFNFIADFPGTQTKQPNKNIFFNNKYSTMQTTIVIKRDGRTEQFLSDKITSRIRKLTFGLHNSVDPDLIVESIVNNLDSKISSSDLDVRAAETAASLRDKHPDFDILGGRILVSKLNKETKKQFSSVIEELYKSKDKPLIAESLYKIVQRNADRLNSEIIYNRDFNYSYHAYKILEHSFLLKINDKVVERPQHLILRTALGLHGEDINAAIKTYNLMSRISP
ncbi:YIL066Cp-like protein [Gonapodya prolifera JEL478]|uniref:YIL066Cp-like protein n=1 Tax=Gonapodya prolifera (strain JEL478) TaxID=1344416 RepID=A0A138ZWL8_GONPJ|nr:YIL066Cp-like protein [Gonapodya prolifera JEL478]|eukprot:KXS08899.1 YIL066Cp-like protein [Gonapodya prolifera JEL478]